MFWIEKYLSKSLDEIKASIKTEIIFKLSP